MKRSPQMQRLEETLRASKLTAGGFLGADARPLEEILDADAAALFRLGYTRTEVGARMREMTAAARAGLGTAVPVAARTEGQLLEARGRIVCPWPHPGTYRKEVTSVRRRDTGCSLQWSALGIHLIEAHGFFGGRGARFRLEPAELVEILFEKVD